MEEEGEQEEEGGGGWGQREEGGQMKERQLMWKERIKMMPGKVKSEAKNSE